MPNYELKSQAIKKHYCYLERQLAKKKYLYYALKASEFSNDISILEAPARYEYLKSTNILFNEAVKMANADYHRKARIKKRISCMLEHGQCLFLTLTFNDNVISNTNDIVRRKYVLNYLRLFSTQYVANVDYGIKNDREHYHAVLLTDNVDMSKWLYGFAYVERINNNINDAVKLSKYISKLTNHAIKETTKRNCVIYSR